MAEIEEVFIGLIWNKKTHYRWIVLSEKVKNVKQDVEFEEDEMLKKMLVGIFFLGCQLPPVLGIETFPWWEPSFHSQVKLHQYFGLVKNGVLHYICGNFSDPWVIDLAYDCGVSVHHMPLLEAHEEDREIKVIARRIAPRWSSVLNEDDD
ncbi:hypothetical protein MTR_3g490845 [Medicago truncatula]|uniref:Uncharacterized protein n=1 Tax=Medicago truncatula TaxID=3880 RepID=A0A072V184_MEDTR|nr:hypothetical protein MTR_3g490845 [Medicago truncatula]